MVKKTKSKVKKTRSKSKKKSAKKMWGKIGAPGSRKRSAHMSKIAKKPRRKKGGK